MILLFCIVLTVGGVIAVFTGYRRVMNQAGGLVSSIQDGAGMAISCVRQTAVRNGIMEWCMDAASAEYLNAENRAEFISPAVTFFMEGRDKIMLTAEKGTVRTDSNNISVSGNVVVKDADYVLKTEALKYDNADQMFLTNTPVALSGTDFNLTAESASLNMKSRQAVLKGNVRGTLREDIQL